VVAAYHALLSPEVVAAMRGKGKRVFAWTVDAPGDVARALDLHVDGIVTNAVRQVVEAAKQRRSGTCRLPALIADA
jgi:glycerophosphoryl diester phosphodiesterase